MVEMRRGLAGFGNLVAPAIVLHWYLEILPANRPQATLPRTHEAGNAGWQGG